jgi:hypothetical protein
MRKGVLPHVIAGRLRAVSDGLGFWRAHGARLRAARISLDWADAILVRGERDGKRRASRLYRYACNLLAPALLGLNEQAPTSETGDADTAHRALRLSYAPCRAAWLSLMQLLATGALVVALAAAIACGASPRLRRHWFPADLAAGRPWRVSSSWNGYPTQGIGPSSAAPIFFHTQETDRPWLEIELGGEHLIRSVTLVNRTDCCQMRAVPIDVLVPDGNSWRLIAERRSPFKSWSRDVAPVRARLVRVQLPGFGILHLNKVSIYGE